MEDKQVTLRNNGGNLPEDSLLQKFANKFQEGYEITLTPKEAKRLVLYLNTIKTGFQACVPMICMGEQCPYNKKCPLGDNKNFPMGQDCPFEQIAREVWYHDYAENLNVTGESKVDEALVNDLVFWEVLQKRAAEELAANPKIVKKTVAGFQNTKEGLKPVFKDELNQVVTFLEKAQRQKLKIMDALIATREAKSKDTSRILSDPSTYAAKLLDKARELEKKAKEAGMVEGEVVEDASGESAK